MQSVYQIMFVRHANLPHVSPFQQSSIYYFPSQLHTKSEIELEALTG